MKTEEFRKLDEQEIEVRIQELRKGLFDARIKHATGQLEKTGQLRLQRRELARALTVLRQKESRG